MLYGYYTSRVYIKPHGIAQLSRQGNHVGISKVMYSILLNLNNRINAACYN
jgi:hypothetical protein